MQTSSTLSNVVISVVGQYTISPPSLSSTPIPPSTDPRALRSLTPQTATRQEWTNSEASDIRESILRETPMHSLLVRVLTVEGWWHTPIRKSLMKLPTDQFPQVQIVTDLVLQSIIFPSLEELLRLCKCFSQLCRLQLVKVRWYQPGMPQSSGEYGILANPNLAELHIVGQTPTLVRLS